MKLAFISPDLPPKFCGVGDYTACLALELVRKGHTVAIWTRQEKPAPLSAEGKSVIFHSVPAPWSVKEYQRITSELKDWQPDRVIIEFTPSLYGRRGIRLTLPIWLRGLRKKLGVPVFLNAHELNYPVLPTPRGLVLGVPQRLQFILLAGAVDRVDFTYEVAMKNNTRWVAPKAARWVPVGSTIGSLSERSSPHADDEALFKELKGKKILLHFGGSHPTHLLDFVFSAAREAAARFGKDQISLVLVGLSQQEKFERLYPSTHALGLLPAHRVSFWLKRADLVLAPFLDGISTRRSTVMAALEQGRAVVSTQGWATDPSVPWNRVTALSHENQSESFSKRVIELLEDPRIAAETAKTGHEYFLKHFSWNTISEKVLEAL